MPEDCGRCIARQEPRGASGMKAAPCARRTTRLTLRGFRLSAHDIAIW